MLSWVYKYRRNWDQHPVSHVRGAVVAENVKSVRDGTSSQSYDVTLSTGERGTATADVASYSSEQEFWLKTPQGERHVVVYGEYIPLSPGQTVSLICFGGTVVAYINHNSRRDLVIKPNLRYAACAPSFLRHVFLCFIIAPVVLSLLSMPVRMVVPALPRLVVDSIGAIVTLVIGFIVIWTFIGFPILWLFYRGRRRKIEQAVKTKLQAVAGYTRTV
jgi:hypothetical protein